MISSQRSGLSVRSLFARTRTETDGPAFAGAPIRILIVDEIEAWHSIYIGVLRPHEDWQIVGVARNGIEAVQRCWELKPDVVLLDMGPGRTDRVETARQIREVSPKSSLLLLGTAEPFQLAELAELTGAYGYVPKRDVVVELIPIMQALANAQRSRTEPAS